jgi:hypothetical protein
MFCNLFDLSISAKIALSACVEALKNAMHLLCAVFANVRWITGVQYLVAVHYAGA